MVREIDRRRTRVCFRYVDLAAANGWPGRGKEAKEAAGQLQQAIPASRCRPGPTSSGRDDPSFSAENPRITEGLRKAGVPEGEAKTN